MAYNSDAFSGADNNSDKNTDSINLTQNSDGNFDLPSGHIVSNAEFYRDGQDLTLKFSGQKDIEITNYFSGESTSLIQDSAGNAIDESLINSFLQSSPEYAQASSMTDESPVGTVEEIKGSAKVIHADGSTEDITLGTPIYQGDIIQTSGDGAVNIMFVDETSMAISEDARIAVDKYEFDAATESGVTDLSVLRGVFVYTSGLIGRDDPDDVKIDTPVGSIGIRGTIIAGNIKPEGQSEISVLEGAIVIKNGAGETTLSQQFETVQISGFQSTIEYKGVETANDIGKTYGSVNDVLPKLFSSINDAEKETLKEEVKEEVKEDSEIEAIEENSEEVIEEPQAENQDTITESITEIGQNNIETINIENKLNSDQESDIRPKNLNGNHEKINVAGNTSNYEPLYQEAKDWTEAPEIIGHLKPLFESTKAGTVVGIFTLRGYPTGTNIEVNLTGTNTTSGDFTVTSVAGNKFEISLVSNLGAAGATLSAIDIVAVLPDTTIIPIKTNETPTAEDAMVNITSPSQGYNYHVTAGGAPLPENQAIIKDFDGDGDKDHAYIDGAGGIRIQDTASPGSATLKYVPHGDDFVSIAEIGDIDNDGYSDLIGGIESHNVNAGKIGIINGNSSGGTVSYHANPTPYSGDLFGSSVAGIGDFDGDGKSDYAIGAIDNVSAQGLTGGVFIITDGVGNYNKVNGVGNNSLDFGKTVAGIGDFNGDGLSDVIVGSNEGATVILGGTGLGTDASQNALGTRGFNVNIAGANILGASNVGDFNGDGFDDIAVSFGVDSNGDTIDDAVNTYVVYGQAGITADLDLAYLENPDHALKIHDKSYTYGDVYQVTAAGDRYGDGFDDIMVGIEGNEQYILHGEPGGSSSTIVTDGSAEDANTNNGIIKASATNQSLVGDVDFDDSNISNLRMTGGGSNNTFKINAIDQTTLFKSVDGGKGIDKIDIITQNSVLNFTNFKYESVQQIEEINFGNTGQTLTLNAENIFNMLKTSDNGELKINGDLGGLLRIDANTASNVVDALNEEGVGATQQTDQTIDGNTYNHFEIGGYDLYIDTDLTTNVV